MNLILEYKQGDTYFVSLNNQKQLITSDNLKQLIRAIPSEERNCKIAQGNICMKPGYGKLRTKRLVSNHTITIYTDVSYLTKFNKNDILMNINYHFRDMLPKILDNFNSLDKHYINVIDKARVIKVEDRWVIRTGDGVTTLDNISTGCKACILDNHCKNKLINLTPCGENAITALLDVLSKKGGSNLFLLQHSYFKPLAKYNININGAEVGDLCDLCLAIAERG